MNSTAGGGAAAFGYRPPFTASQWQELEQQALIFKHLMAGVPIPHELLIPITRSFDAIAARFYHHPALSYCSLYGKKIDPEPGRCRRTDGKKWRCSKDAYPDSKYCERHMHRGRNRSRKPVEIPQTLSQSHHSTTSSPSSTVTALASTAANANANASGSSGIFQSFPLRSVSPSPQLHIGTTATAATGGSYGMSCRDFRYPYGVKSQVDEHSFFSEASGSLRGHGMVDSSLDNTWNLMPSHSTFPISNERSYPQLHSLANPPHQQQQHLFFGSEYDSSEHVKNEESQSLRPFFNEWPKTRDSWSDLEDERSNHTSFSTTQLSMSIPMASSSDFSTTSSHSPNDD